MAGVDSLLRMMANHGADELRLATDVAPKMLSRGAPVRLSIPPTDDAMLQHLLEGILTPERDAAMRASGKLELSYEAYNVSLQPRGAGVEAIFKKGAAGSRPAAPPPLPAAPAPAPVATPTPIGATALLEKAVSLQASDLHLMEGEPATL